jgi:hypothetical protein
VVVGRSLVVGLGRVEEALLVGDVCFDRLVSDCLALQVDLPPCEGARAGPGPMFLMV